MPQQQTFGPPLIGQTEKALDAILARELEGTGASGRGWVILAVTAGAGGGLSRGELLERAAAALKVDAAVAEAEVAVLIGTGFLGADDFGLTDRARDLQQRVRANVAEVTTRLWGDLPEDELAVAARVLGTVLSRANAELGYSI